VPLHEIVRCAVAEDAWRETRDVHTAWRPCGRIEAHLHAFATQVATELLRRSLAHR
jgi:hypothetical protein